MPRKILITGPESSGKTTIAEALSDALSAKFVGEFARPYLEKKGGMYDESDILKIAKGQAAQEDAASSSSSPWMVCDTGMFVMKIWSRQKFGSVPEWIEEQIQTRRYDIIFLCKPDFPWVADPLRENPNDRDALFIQFHEELKAAGRKYAVLAGEHEERLRNSLTLVASLD